MSFITFTKPGDAAWPPCDDPFCEHFEPGWWPEALEQCALDNADAEVPSPLPPCLFV